MSRFPARILSSRTAGRIVQSVALVALCGLWIAACGSSGTAHGPAHLVYYAPVDPNGTNVKAAETCSRQSGGSYTISITPEANSSDASRALIVQRLAAHDGDYSLLNMDTIWTSEFAAAGWLQKITGAARQEVLHGVLPIAAQSAEYKGGLYAIPLNTNAQLLWYRKDLVPKTPPSTWDAADQRWLRSFRPTMALIEEQGQQYEGYTVWFNSVLASAGGEGRRTPKVSRRSVRQGGARRRRSSRTSLPRAAPTPHSRLTRRTRAVSRSKPVRPPSC